MLTTNPVVPGQSLMMMRMRMVDQQQSLKITVMMMWMVDKQRSSKIKNYDDNDDDCVNNPYTAEAQSPKATRPLTFKNFMDYCHDFASSVWK
jgi:hypothetical protein